jgi:cell division protein FtsB
LKKTVASTGQPRRRSRRILQSVFLLAGCVLVIDALVGDKGLLAMIQARQEFRNLEQSLADVRAENARLRDEARRLREDPSAVEDLARRELGLIKPGEKLFIIRDVAPKDPR